MLTGGKGVTGDYRGVAQFQRPSTKNTNNIMFMLMYCLYYIQIGTFSLPPKKTNGLNRYYKNMNIYKEDNN